MDDGGLEGCIEEMRELAKDKSPYLGMEFPSEKAAYEFYNEYGRRVLVLEEIIRDLSKLIVSKFDSNHNHPLHLPQCTHLMPSQRKVCDAQGINIDIADESGISLKASHNLISAIAGGKEFVGFTREDQKTYFVQKDSETCSMVKRGMITDYGLFGNAVSFDTTFRTNKEYRPLALFCGFNHFRMTVIFGAALLYDETAESFEWLFETFLDAMSGKKPVSFFTDQDQAMAKAISQIMPEVFHGLCTFHLMQNALKHLGYLFKSGSKFSSDLKACIYDYENEHELIEAWNSLIDKYNL
ncbi:protein FAR1-RELATED SEQUENCE 5-like [Camellia sinensis]|uniref:protein FAR1-RELATED SEQUENCE 5-like n=1 Tax=Camellia sinensis TaxID=4442 RepID=UPI0010364503|nr:protein FAR1-RELATED SEQUENCE 5-like [Camellia sinensis]